MSMQPQFQQAYPSQRNGGCLMMPFIGFGLFIAGAVFGIIVGALVTLVATGQADLDFSNLFAADTTEECLAQQWWNIHRTAFDSIMQSEDPDQVLAAVRDVRDEIGNQSYPTCVENARAELLTGMDKLISGFELFITGNQDASVPLINEAPTHFESAYAMLHELGVITDPGS